MKQTLPHFTNNETGPFFIIMTKSITNCIYLIWKATHSSILAWKIPWTEEPGGLQSMALQKSQTRLSTKIHYKDLAHVIMKAGKCRIFRVNWLVSWKSRGPWRASVTVWSLQTGSQSHQSELHPGCVLVSNQEIRPCPLWLPASYEFPTSKKDKDAFLLLLLTWKRLYCSYGKIDSLPHDEGISSG